MTFPIVQFATSVGTGVCQFASNVTAGNVIVAFWGAGTSGSGITPPTSVTDDESNAYVKASQSYFTNQGIDQIWVVKSAVGGTMANLTFHGASGIASGEPQIIIAEVGVPGGGFDLIAFLSCDEGAGTVTAFAGKSGGQSTGKFSTIYSRSPYNPFDNDHDVGVLFVDAAIANAMLLSGDFDQHLAHAWVPGNAGTTIIAQTQNNTFGSCAVVGYATSTFATTCGGTSTLAISCNNPPAGTVGIAYSHAFPAVGGTPPYTYALISGAVPGLTFNTSTGVLSGTPTTQGSYNLQVGVTDSLSNTANVTCTVVINAAPATLTLSCNNPPGGQVGVFYDHALGASGGVPPYTFVLLSGSLPLGLTLDSTSGVISGTPTAIGTYSFTVQVTDSNSATATVTCSISITGGYPPGTVTVLYEWQPSFIPKREVTIARVTDYMDCGSKGLKWIQGLRIHANTFGNTRTIQVQYDGGQTGPTLTVTHNGELILPYSFTPFLAHFVRLVPDDATPLDWALWDPKGDDWVFTPVPENVEYWVARPTSFGFEGFFHIREGVFAYGGSGTLTITMDTGETQSITIPTSGALVEAKFYFPTNPLKGQLATLSAIGSPSIQVYVEDIELRAKQWGSTGPWRVVRLPGDISQVAARI